MGFFKKLFRIGGKKTKPETKVVASKGKADSVTDHSNPDTDEPPSGKGHNLRGNKNGTSSSPVRQVRKSRGPDLSDGTQRPILAPRNEGLVQSTIAVANSLPPKYEVRSAPVDLDESICTDNNSLQTPHKAYTSSLLGNDENHLLLPADGEDFSDLQPIPQPMTTYQMPDDQYPKTRFSAGQINLGSSDDLQSDGESSSFNFSTDAEDTEYEALRRRIGMMPANGAIGGSATNATSIGQGSFPGVTMKPGFQSSVLDMSDVSSPTYNTDGEGSVFPNLPTDDEATMTAESQGSLSVKEMQPRSLLGGAPYPDPDDEHDVLRGHRQDNNSRQNIVQEDNIDAWNPPVSSIVSGKKKEGFSISYSSKFMDAMYGGSSKSQANSVKSPSPIPAPRAGPTSPKRKEVMSSSRDSFGFAADPFADFADFTDFDNKFENRGHQNKQDSKPQQASQSTQNPTEEIEKGSASWKGSKTPFSGSIGTSLSSSAVHNETSLSELLAQAKSKSSRHPNGRKSSGSVNSAPVISTAAYLRQHHNLKPRHPTNSSSVTDIIQSLEAANASRITSAGGRSGSSQNRSESNGSRDGTNPALRAAKDRVRRRRERENGAGSHELDSSDEEWDDENKINESWLFKEVEETLGPRGIAADLESLSGRSNRSSSSRGNRSHKSHRSHRSHRSQRNSSSRHRRHPSTSGGSGDSVDSHGEKSHGSRRSRSSRFSHKSTRSYISQMSEQSRSVANDLLRLEMQLKMVGSNTGDGADGSAVGSSAADRSIGGSKRGTARSSSSRTGSSRTRPVASTARRSRITVTAPPGKLGIILVNKADSKGTVVSGVRTSSVLSDKVHPGDRIVAIDGEDVSHMSVSEITTIMARKSEFERTLTVLTTPRHHPYVAADAADNNSSLGSPRSPGKSYSSFTH